MKIAILSFYSGINTRGVEMWTCEIASRLSDKHEVVVFQNGTAIRGAKYKIDSLNLPFQKNKIERPFFLQNRAFLDYKSRKIAFFSLKILIKLWKGDFDIIIPTDGGWESAFIRILTWLKGKRMIVVGHAGVGWDDKNNLWCFPDCFVALSTFAKYWAKKINPLIKVEYIPNGVDLRKFSFDGKKAKINLKTPIVLTVGALEKFKRVDLTIKAVSKLSNTSLLVVGGGELAEELTNLGKKYLGKRFLVCELNHDDLPGVYRSCDVFASSSLPYFSFEMVILEAMSSNLPVVVNDDSIRREIVGKAGDFVDPTKIDDYALALDKTLKINWGNKPRKQAVKFSWDRVVNEYEKLFQSVIKS